MIKLTFLGTGEAFDPNRSNTSYLIENEGKSIMVDCGYDSTKSLMRYLAYNGFSTANSPDALLLTHEHGDHTAGIHALLITIWEESNGIVGDCKISKQRKLEILSANPNLLKMIPNDVERYYQGFWNRFKKEGPDINMRAINSKNDELYGFKIKSAKSTHGAVNFSYRFETSNEKSFGISGDGALNEDTKELFKEVNFLAHDGLKVSGTGGENHASIEEVLNYAISVGIPRIGIVHVNRQERKKQREIEGLIEKAKDNGINLFLPRDHQSIEI